MQDPGTRRRTRRATLLALAASLAIGGGIAAPAAAAPGDPITVPDAGFLECINTALGQGPSDVVTESQAATITTLDCTSAAMGDLTGAHFLTSMTNVSIAWTGVTDVTPLAALPALTTLNAWATGITDLSGIAALPHLTNLNVSENGITDLTPLASHPTLTVLDASINNLADIDELAGNTQLGSLNVDVNGITDLTPIASMALTSLSADHNEISDVTPLASTAIVAFGLAGNRIADLTPLAAWAEPYDFDLSDQVVDLGSLPLGVAEPNPVVAHDGTPVALTDARYDSGSNAITPAGALGPASLPWSTSLTIAYATGTFSGSVVFEQVDAPSPAIEIPDANLLACINAALGQGPSDEVTEAQAATLTTLDCADEDIEDLTGMEHFTGLTTLDLSGNAIVDISPLAGLSAITSADLSGQSRHIGTVYFDQPHPSPLVSLDGTPVVPTDPRYVPESNSILVTGSGGGSAEPLPWSQTVRIGSADVEFSGNLWFDQVTAPETETPQPSDTTTPTPSTGGWLPTTGTALEPVLIGLAIIAVLAGAGLLIARHIRHRRHT